MVVISTQAERWALSEDGPGAVGLLQKIDEFIGILAENSETLPFLKKCRLYVHSERADLVDEDNIRVSANGLVENGPAATAELFISKIREQEEQERLASKASEAAPPEGFEKKEGGVTEEGGEQNENAESPKPEEGEDREGLPKEPSNRIPP